MTTQYIFHIINCSGRLVAFYGKKRALDAAKVNGCTYLGEIPANNKKDAIEKFTKGDKNVFDSAI